MSFTLSIGPLVSLIAGILILVMPRLLSTIVALYLIIMGILGLLGMHSLKFAVCTQMYQACQKCYRVRQHGAGPTVVRGLGVKVTVDSEA